MSILYKSEQIQTSNSSSWNTIRDQISREILIQHEKDILEFKLYKDIRVVKYPSKTIKNYLVKSNYTVKNTTYGIYVGI